MSTKLGEPRRGAGEDRMIKEEGKGKRKGQLETSSECGKKGKSASREAEE